MQVPVVVVGFPSLPSWVPGTSIGLGSDLYRLHASDGTTGADGTSEPFRITREYRKSNCWSVDMIVVMLCCR